MNHATEVALILCGIVMVLLLVLLLLRNANLCQFCEEEKQTGTDGLCDLCRKIKDAIEEQEAEQ